MLSSERLDSQQSFSRRIVKFQRLRCGSNAGTFVPVYNPLFGFKSRTWCLSVCVCVRKPVPSYESQIGFTCLQHAGWWGTQLFSWQSSREAQSFCTFGFGSFSFVEVSIFRGSIEGNRSGSHLQILQWTLSVRKKREATTGYHMFHFFFASWWSGASLSFRGDLNYPRATPLGRTLGIPMVSTMKE